MAVHLSTWLAATLLWTIPAAAEPRWIRIQSQHFEVFSSAGERATRDTARHFEQVRGLFADAFGRDGKATQPVRIVIFGTRREFEPYRVNEFAAAYYRPGAERDYIVLSEAGLASYPVATHEYVHLIVNHAGMKLPPWLNEGLAELYSTLKPQGDKVLVGSLIEGRQQALLLDRWVPLATICGADRESAYYNEKDKAGALYNEGWALTHMLALSAEYRQGFRGFVQAILAGLDAESALMKTYSRTLKQMDEAVQAYVRRDVFQAALLPVKLVKSQDALAAEPATPFDVRMTLAELSDLPGKTKDVAALLQQLAQAFPDQHEVHSALGYLEWRGGRSEQARVHFRRAFELGSRSPRFLWDYGRMASGADSGQAIAAIMALLAIEPGRAEARVELAGLQLAAGRRMEARQTIASVTSVTPELAPRFFHVLAYVEESNGYREEAKKAARRWQETAASPTEKQAAAGFAASLARQTSATPPVFVPADLEQVQRPSLRRGEVAAPPSLEQDSALKFDGKAEGQFIELQCMESQAIFVIEAGGARQSFLIDDPLKITIAGGNGASMGLTCGRQAPKPVKVEFDKPGQGQPAVRGLLRLVDFGG